MDEEKIRIPEGDSDSDHLKLDHKNGQETIVTNGEVLTTIDPKAERKLVWKIDLHVLPVLAVMVNSGPPVRPTASSDTL
jgi:hypothetical protein